ncbi:MAG TPA: secretin N-terminal domain-containing protein [Candidatus Hydrogenedentes bacterium]|nr:secretin N-terminal domain-containing protein [Candidatus Hydrogenedentota bacterium]HPG65299.1 secretin N-terminal domain-containing protein [Candidatus Hydrogenedentota bacterium]
MNDHPKSLWQWLVCILFIIGLALPVCAQGQTPTRPNTPASTGTSQLVERVRQEVSRVNQEREEKKEGSSTSSTSRTERTDTKTDAEKKPTVPEKATAKPESRGQRSSAPTTRAVQGQGGGGGAVRTVGGERAASVSVLSNEPYQPVLNRPVEYAELPEVGEALTLTGPMPMTEFLETISFATNWNILVTPGAQDIELQFWLTEATPKRAIEEVFKFHSVYYRFDPNTQYLYVMTKEEYLNQEYGALKEEVFTVEHVDVTYMESALTSLLSPAGRIITDPRTMHIYVWDTEDNLKKMRETLDELDVPLQRGEFTVQNADVSDIESVFQTLMSQTGTMVSDPRTGQILVWDVPDALSQMRAAAAQLDVPVESRVLRLEHVDANAVMESIEVMLTERGMIQVDPRTNTLVVTDLPARQALIAKMIEEFDKRLETRTWTLKYADPDMVAEEVELLVPEEMGIVTINEDVHQVTVTALPERLDQIDKLVVAWDVKLRQVQIEAYLLTAGSKVARSIGTNWHFFDSTGNTPISFSTGGATPNFTGAQGRTIQAGQLPYAVPLNDWITAEPISDITGETTVIEKLAGNRVSAVINYLDSTGEVNVLSHPQVTVQDGAEAIFERTSAVPYVSSTYYGQTTSRYNTNTVDNDDYRYRTAYRPQNSISFIDVGTILSVTPRITEDSNILLDISAEESTYTMREVVGADETSTVPEKMMNRAETQVLVHDNQTIVIGGLRTNNLSDDVDKVPFLGDVPLLGRAFRNVSKKHDNQQLLVFITTTLVDEYTQPEAEQLATMEEKVTETVRHDKKDAWKRLSDSLDKKRYDVSVSIGQSGYIRCDGKNVTQDELGQILFALDNPASKTLVLREHPRAPREVGREVTETALEVGIKVDFDKGFLPFVPSYNDLIDDETTGEGVDAAKGHGGVTIIEASELNNTKEDAAEAERPKEEGAGSAEPKEEAAEAPGSPEG